MSDKKYVLDGALVQCDQGFTPAKLMVTENQKVKIQGKFKATDMDVQIPQTFGQCKLKPTSGGYLPCVPALQKWMKTSKNVSLGKTKKFLFEDSECMCATGGKVTITKGMQINIGGTSSEKFKEIASLIPGAMPGADVLPRIIDAYWMNDSRSEQLDEMEYGNNASMQVVTENMDAGTPVTIKIIDQNSKSINGKENQLTYTGKVKANGTAQLELLETEKDWNLIIE